LWWAHATLGFNWTFVQDVTFYIRRSVKHPEIGIFVVLSGRFAKYRGPPTDVNFCFVFTAIYR